MNKYGELSVKMLPGNKVKFLIFTMAGMQSCNIGRYTNAIADLTDKSHATFKGDGNCLIEFNFEKNKVTLKTKNCVTAYCGINASGSMEGAFTKKGNTPEFYGTDR